MTALPSLRSARRALAVVAAGAAVAVPLGALAASPASADAGTAPYVGGYPDTEQVGQPVSFDFYRSGSPAPTCAVTAGALPPGITLDPAACGLRGTPSRSGGYTFTVTATNGIDPAAAVTSTVAVDGPPAIIKAQPLEMMEGAPYRYPLTAVSEPAATFHVIGSQQLPPGVQLSADGVLSGYPTSDGDYPVTVEAYNAFGSDTYAFTLHVARPPLMMTGTPPAATAGTYYSFSFALTGIPTPSLTVTSGQLPAGLILAGNAIYGTPSTPAAGAPVTVTASNGVDPDVSTTFTLPVAGTPATISGTPPTPALYQSYFWRYTLGGIPHPSTAVTAGSLPPGLQLDADGYLTGVANVPGHYAFTVTASNGSGPDASIDSVVDVPSPLGFSGTAPAGTVGSPYSFQFAVSGTPQPTVSTDPAGLPPGLTLSPAGLLSGVPTQAGVYGFTLQVANGVSPTLSPSVTLTVGAPSTGVPSVSVAGNRMTEGNTGTRAMTFRVSLSRASTVPVTVHWSTANGTAKAGSDYVAGAGPLTFAPGQTTRTVTVLVKGDRTREPNETFTVRLTGPAHATLGHATATGTIVNDD